jgi:RNA polymerase sigma-70 factor (ECF subfamily)
MGVPESDAEEIAADALMKVQKSLPKYRADRGAKLTTWVFEIARNCAIDYRRRASQQAAQHEEFCLEYCRGNGFDTLDPSDSQTKDAKAVDVALAALSPSDRDILRMREVMEYSEIARAEQTTEQAVRVRHKRALDRLKEQIAQGRTHG